jgi:exodeoxyribonuclease V alpha subunit
MKIEPKPSDREALAGSIERVTYQNAESGFCVVRVRIRGRRELVTLVGHAAAISAGEWITATGAEPDRLREVDGIGPIRAGRIIAAWAEQKVVREIMVFLHSHGVGTARAVRTYKTYDADAVQMMSENPYRLARDIRGIGFKTADAIAMRLGVDKTALVQVRAGISYALTEAMNEGHCGLPTDELMPLATQLLALPQDLILIRTALDLELADGTVIASRVGDQPCVFLAGLYRAERAIADRLLQPWPSIDPDKVIPWIEQRTGLVFAESQRSAVALALTCKVLVITGGPGVGKTTLVLVACVWRACHYSANFSYSAIFCTLLTNFTLTDYYPRGDKERPKGISASWNPPRLRSGSSAALRYDHSAAWGIHGNAIQLNGK